MLKCKKHEKLDKFLVKYFISTLNNCFLDAFPLLFNNINALATADKILARHMMN